MMCFCGGVINVFSFTKHTIVMICKPFAYNIVGEPLLRHIITSIIEYIHLVTFLIGDITCINAVIIVFDFPKSIISNSTPISVDSVINNLPCIIVLRIIARCTINHHVQHEGGVQLLRPKRRRAAKPQ